MDFEGTERFRVVSTIGHGGMGVVYRALDRTRGEVVALKTLASLAPASLLQFKREFRALSEISHPNLVALYELEAADDQWFFTMELIEGVSFLTRVRPPSSPQEAVSASEDASYAVADTITGVPQEDDGGGEIPALTAPSGRKLDFDDLRSVLRHVAEGVHELHLAGKLHCDLKPNNVLVTPAGRAVVLDFGLVTEIAPAAPDARSKLVSGTPAYMAPEQAAGKPLAEPADWYAFGVMLFEALTGVRPFVGSNYEVMKRKQLYHPPAPSTLAPGVPKDLDRLAHALLSPRPADRPDGREILSMLGAAPSASRSSIRTRTAMDFVGREAELAELKRAEESARDRAVLALVHGRSGMGKSALVEAFLAQARSEGAVVLAGRCYEREHVPYKALDALMDGLARFLTALPEEERASLLPEDAGLLARIFPVLTEATGGSRAPASLPPPELRRRAFAALRSTLSHVAARRQLVLAIDDVQWGDADSAAFIADLLAPPHPPPLLVLLSFRSEERASSVLLSSLVRAKRAIAAETRELAIEALPRDEAERLAKDHLADQRSALVHAERVAEESGGSPFFIGMLARATLEDGTPPALGEVVERSIERLGPGPRSLLEAAAVAGRPRPLELLRAAAKVDFEDRAKLAALWNGKLLRSSYNDGVEHTEPYHDRIREAVVAGLEPERLASLHGAIASQMEVAGIDDPSALAGHYKGAGLPEKAIAFALRAAADAEAALAFRRAADYYAMAIEMMKPEGERARELYQALGDALSNAGHGKSAAEAYLAAAGFAGADEGRALERMAAEELLVSGQIDEGRKVLDRVLRTIGLTLDRSMVRAVLTLLWLRARLSLMGGVRDLGADRPPPSDAMRWRADVCWTVSRGMRSADLIAGVEFHTRFAIHALQTGAPEHIARALAMEVSFFGLLQGPRGEARAKRLVEDLDRVLARRGKSALDGEAEYARAMIDVGNLRWREAVQRLRAAEDMLRGEPGTTWEMNSSQWFLLGCAFYAGALRYAATRLPVMISQAEERGDTWHMASLRTGTPNVMWLVTDDVEGSLEAIESAAAWAGDRPETRLVRGLDCFARARRSTYLGEGREGYERFERDLRVIEAAGLGRLPITRMELTELRARLLIMVASEEAHPEPWLRRAERHARKLASERCAFGAAWSRLLLGAISAMRGDEQKGVEALAAAAEMFEAQGALTFARATSARLGELVGGDRGQALIAEAEAWMRSEMIARPDRFVDLVAPRVRRRQERIGH